MEAPPPSPPRQPHFPREGRSTAVSRTPADRRPHQAHSCPPANWASLVGSCLRGDDEPRPGLSPAAARFIWNGLSASSRVSVENSIRRYVSYAARQGWTRPYFPIQRDQMVNFVAAEATRRGQEGPLAIRSLESLVSSLSSWHVDLGLDPAACTGPLLTRAIRGAYRTCGVATAAATMPITLPILCRVLRLIKNRPRDFGGHVPSCALRTAFALAFGCFLRMGELTRDEFLPQLHLSWDCIDFGDGTAPATLCLKASKTDRLGQGVKVVIPWSGGEACPVTHLREWQAVSGSCSPRDPLFHLPGGHFPKKVVVAALRRALTHAGLPANQFTGHSFRRGAATWAASIGIPDAEIRVLGRWSSAAQLRYVDTPAAAIADISRRCLNPAAATSLPPSGLPERSGIWSPKG